ncbi:hypothetical protein BRY75_16030 [Acinetobacter baumannii]|uniref:hypothetical protein n=1 Tax=Acinetobacter baumannii TaxID=470 RepID=UPI000925D284|nr:hypothetical protein [Acinetobacter baumannii]OJK06109.1 hypothetical protein BRY75_16030 [Acinetobacter baumannii]
MQEKIDYFEISDNHKHACNSITFFYQTDESDRKYIDDLLTRAHDLSQKVNTHAASNSLQTRNQIIVKANAIAGLLAEDLWAYCINKENTSQLVYIPTANDLSNQIDIASLNDSYTFEVRSSFPRNGIAFAVTNANYGFKIVGPYSNTYKKSENFRDFYLTVLFPLQRPGDILTAIKKDGFTFSLTGGATLDMMTGDNSISFIDSLRPEDAFTEETTEYQLIKIKDGLDYCEILGKIINTLR